MPGRRRRVVYPADQGRRVRASLTRPVDDGPMTMGRRRFGVVSTDAPRSLGEPDTSA